MLAAIRNSLNHWIVKGLFLILIGSFAIWGIGDFVRGTATDRPVATVAGSRISLAEAADGGKSDTRRYTKRQFTWFRHQLPEFSWTAPEAASGAVRAVFAAAP